MQYILDSKGEKTGVFIPIKEWEKIQGLLKKVDEQNMKGQEEQVLKGVQEAVNEVNQYKAGKTELKSLDQFLDEL